MLLIFALIIKNKIIVFVVYTERVSKIGFGQRKSFGAAENPIFETRSV